MSLNKQYGNMYPWVTHTWNAIKGKCPHDCSYCYMKRFPQKELRFDKKEMKTDLGKGNTIFVGSSCDMWANDVPQRWIAEIINHCEQYPNNTYLFQSKNPHRIFLVTLSKYHDIKWKDNVIIGTTIESNRDYDNISKAPPVNERAYWMTEIPAHAKMVSIEPILDFDVDNFVDLLGDIAPSFISIGADSKNNGLPEPSAEKIKELVGILSRFTQVKIKKNLNRIVQHREES